jgi:hypothetical protein
MPKIIVNAFLTLDGVMQAPGGPDEDPEGGFLHGGWQGPYSDPRHGAASDRRTGGRRGFPARAQDLRHLLQLLADPVSPDDKIILCLEPADINRSRGGPIQ